LRIQTNEHTVSKKTDKATNKLLSSLSLKLNNMKRAGGLEIKIHASLTLALNVSKSEKFPPGKECLIPFVQKVVWSPEQFQTWW
jgi:hypothetical protein